MRRFRIVVVTAAVVIAVAAWWVPLEMGGAGHECPGSGTCAARPPVQGGSNGPDWFYGGEGVDRIRGDEGDRPNLRMAPRGEDEIHCGPTRDEAPTGVDEELPRSCEDVGDRLY